MHTFLSLCNISLLDIVHYSFFQLLIDSFQFGVTMNSGAKTILYMYFGEYMYNQIGF